MVCNGLLIVNMRNWGDVDIMFFGVAITGVVAIPWTNKVPNNLKRKLKKIRIPRKIKKHMKKHNPILSNKRMSPHAMIAIWNLTK